MNLRKFISGVSAFAVAASAFAAMAVTASATETTYHESITLTLSNRIRVQSYGKVDSYEGVATATAFNSGEYSALHVDFSSLPDIADATSVTVKFETYLQSNTKVVYGYGDASQRTEIADGNGGYRTTGLAGYFGSPNGTEYWIYDKLTSQHLTLSSTYFGAKVPAEITFNKSASNYTIKVGNRTQTMDTNIGNLTYIDAFTNTSGARYMFNNITVDYTVPDPVTTTKKYAFDSVSLNQLGETINVDVVTNLGNATDSFSNSFDGFSGDALLGLELEVEDGIEITSIKVY